MEYPYYFTYFDLLRYRYTTRNTVPKILNTYVIAHFVLLREFAPFSIAVIIFVQTRRLEFNEFIISQWYQNMGYPYDMQGRKRLLEDRDSSLVHTYKYVNKKY